MKSQILALAALVSVSAFAGPTSMPSAGSSTNEDLSVTIMSPHLLRGNKSLFISTSSPSAYVCRALGFTYFLEGEVTSGEASVGLAILGAEGNYLNVNPYNSYRVESISCYNELTPMTQVEEKIENPDSTFTITNPKYLRGSKAYGFSTSSNANGVCKTLGFEKVLDGSVFSGDASVKLAMIGIDGKFTALNPYNSYSVKEITCAKGDVTPVLVDASGRKYSRKN